ncbi:helix-turn-helix domain-containing protein [Oceanobacillus profundus]|uniref:helix-turn-helix domain-containing protein n=1 Tax=Oceanobacillus profundus TaxID=372463 RepID=UPI0036429F39
MDSSDDKSQEVCTIIEAANKLGLDDRTIKRMCEQGKFKGAFRVKGNGDWRIPEENFITSKKDDETAEIALEQIDKKNKQVVDIDEFNL